MKRLLSIFLICINCYALSAQVEVTGQVKDMQTKTALEFCSVSVVNKKDSLIKGCVTDNNGYFTVSLNKGYYRFIISYIGYKPDTTAGTVIMENKFIGVFKLNPDEKLLKEVSVKASSHENLIDRDEQVVTDKMRAGASDTKDVLDKINGVQYDRYNNTIKVDNDSKVLILVDGMEKDQEYIKNLAPDRLKKVEVIRSPGGRYALEGYSAIINIILKKDYQGTEIFLSDRSMVKPDAVKSEYIPVQNNLSGTVNYVYNKLNVYAKYSRDYNNFNLPSTDQKVYNNGLMIDEVPLPSIKNDMNTNVKQLFNNYTLGADYYINPKHTISFESSLSNQPLHNNITNQFFNVNYSLNGDDLENLTTQTTNKTENTNTYNSLFYEGKLDENNVINSNFTYSNYNDSYTNLYSDNLLNSINGQGKDNKNSTKFYAEYTHTFHDKTSLQVGYGNTWEKLNNNYTVDTLSTLKYTDIRHKFYAYYSWQNSKKFSMKFGAAAETSAPDANGQKNTYLIFQPYADIKYNVTKALDIKLKYRAGSTYPNISQTNPFTTVVDMQSVRTGNPFLHPEVTHKISLDADILNGFMTIEPYYHFSNNFITETGTLQSDSIFKYTYSNAGNYKHYGVETRIAFPLGKSIIFQTDFNIFKSSVTYSGKTNEFNDWTMSSQLVYQRQKSGTVAVFQYQKNIYKDISAEGYYKNDNDYWIFLIQQPFFKQKLQVMLLYFLPLNLGVHFDQGNGIKTDNFSETTINDISFLKNMFLLQVSFRFNKGKTVNSKEKNIEKETEKNTKGVL